MYFENGIKVIVRHSNIDLKGKILKDSKIVTQSMFKILKLIMFSFKLFPNKVIGHKFDAISYKFITSIFYFFLNTR